MIPSEGHCSGYTSGSRVVEPKQVSGLWKLGIKFASVAIPLLDRTFRYRLIDPHRTWDEVIQAGPVIFAIWHNRLALSIPLYRRFVLSKCPDRRLAALVSASRDGGVLAALLHQFGVRAVRGSTSRRAAPALLELSGLGQNGYDLAITPDGPRGPRYRLQEGIIGAAQLSGLPLVPVGVWIQWKKVLKSWDRFQIPLPFSSIVVEFGAAISVPPQISQAERQRLRNELEQIMNRINRD